MRGGARTPEELETLFEDAFVTRDRGALPPLFEDGALLVAGDDPCAARGGEAVERLARAIWEDDHTYVAGSGRVLQARDTALVLSKRSTNVVRRGDDGAWRYAIALLSLDHTTTKEKR
ncbi:MAG: hypothetical protein M3350_09185 [Actinomycetota bacterium]|nr:hypothetical protein [Actinomycetota bacterium]MDQ3720934.1 hypothetical protein [Actinomycetota bacterium]